MYSQKKNPFKSGVDHIGDTGILSPHHQVQNSRITLKVTYPAGAGKISMG